MGSLVLKNLDSGKASIWMHRAEEFLPHDPANSFISVWIAFTFYYSAFTREHTPEFITWANDLRGKKSCKTQWMFLIRHRAFKEFLDGFKAANLQLFEESLTLPVRDTITGRKVPEGLTGRHTLGALDPEQLFTVLYQIRNNLFHGGSGKTKNSQRELYTLAGGFMLPLLRELLKSSQEADTMHNAA